MMSAAVGAALAVLGVRLSGASVGRCDGCSGSRVLPSGPCSGSLWCFVYRRTVPPQSTCHSFLPASQEVGGEVGSEGFASCSVSTTATKSHKWDFS